MYGGGRVGWVGGWVLVGWCQKGLVTGDGLEVNSTCRLCRILKGVGGWSVRVGR